uniref:PDEase domain-containing protein n=1 Tax=Hucho hucho TaxID=62062 RepID=A0A4W5N4C5_9TELE
MGVFMHLCVKGQSGKVTWVCFCVCDRELRALVIEMVLATDMSSHLVQVKAMKGCLQQHEGIDKPKALSLLLHTADISHPSKPWGLHSRWTKALMDEFFRQVGPMEELITRNRVFLTVSVLDSLWYCVGPGLSCVLCGSWIVLCTVSVLDRLVYCVDPGSSCVLCLSWIVLCTVLILDRLVYCRSWIVLCTVLVLDRLVYCVGPGLSCSLLLIVFETYFLSFCLSEGDREAELGLPFSPLCDRNSTLVAESQIGFIDFIVDPTFSLLTDVAEKIVIPLVEDNPGPPDPCNRHRWHSNHVYETRTPGETLVS